MNFDGKYVCCGNKEGGFCFARIVGEMIIGTATGKQEAFVVEDRIAKSGDGCISKHIGRSTIRKSVLNLQRDIFDRKQGMGDMSDDQLFMLALAGRADGGDGLHLGVANMIEAEMGKPLEELAKIKLKDRLGIDVDSDHEIVEDDKIREEGPNVALDVFVSG